MPPRVMAEKPLLQDVLSDLESIHGFTFLDRSEARPTFLYAEDVRVYVVGGNHFADLAPVKKDLCDRLAEINWFYSEMDGRERLLFIAPMIPAPHEIVYHATRSGVFPMIQKAGVVPSTPEIGNNQRADCFGNIYACSELGEPAERSGDEPRKETSHWWRWHFSQNNRWNDPDW